MSNNHNSMPDWEGLSKETENVLGDRFWTDFQKIMPKKTPPIDIVETETTGFIYIELPGITKKEHVKISFHGQNLIIEGNVPEPFPSEEHKIVHSERFLGAFKRSFIIPFSFSHNNVTASYENGIFILKIPKTETHFHVPFNISKK
ncbi:Hsp20/alpha crystallin family protein [Bacillus massiliigorillae]|uniref:Hsp20/alpha crystallin family protein n=1 Tax=Bacillus massiliigorillae TaxID=1243664 RepID=UPI0003A74DEB|nr:Hsp20/alpha crystallin family protein [Bacillus massiliigorillae]